MKKPLLAICDAEEEYVRCFCSYVREREEYPFEALAFTSLAALLTFCQGETVILVLLAQELYEEGLKSACSGKLDLLTEEDSTERDRICRYQPCAEIIKQALRFLEKELPDKENLMLQEMFSAKGVLPVREGRLQLIGFFTPVHRCMQTSFAITMGEVLAKEHKVLYLNFESFSGLDRRLEREFEADLSDLVYYVTNAREALLYKLGSMTETLQRLDYIPPVFSWQDLAQITPKQWIELFSELERLTAYEYVILDLAEGMQGLFELLRMCRKVFTIVGRDDAASSKLYHYERLLEQAQQEEILKKTRKCTLPQIKNLTFITENLTYGALADYAREMVRKEIYGA